MTPPSGSVPLTYGSVKFRWKVDRKTVPGNAFVNIVSAAGVFLTKVSAKDPAVKFKHNVPFDFVQTFSGAQVIRFGAAITAFTSSLTAIVDNAIGGQLGSNIVFTVSAVGRRIRFSQSSLSGSVVVNASVIRNVGTMTPTALITTSTLRI